jgi:hypothetical protein
MVARGDLGVEIPTYEVPTVQKDIVSKCNKEGKVVIVATQVCGPGGCARPCYDWTVRHTAAMGFLSSNGMAYAPRSRV